MLAILRTYTIVNNQPGSNTQVHRMYTTLYTRTHKSVLTFMCTQHLLYSMPCCHLGRQKWTAITPSLVVNTRPLVRPGSPLPPS